MAYLREGRASAGRVVRLCIAHVLLVVVVVESYEGWWRRIVEEEVDRKMASGGVRDGKEGGECGECGECGGPVWRGGTMGFRVKSKCASVVKEAGHANSRNWEKGARICAHFFTRCAASVGSRNGQLSPTQ